MTRIREKRMINRSLGLRLLNVTGVKKQQSIHAVHKNTGHCIRRHSTVSPTWRFFHACAFTDAAACERAVTLCVGGMERAKH